jgi:hypothetical protein
MFLLHLTQPFWIRGGCLNRRPRQRQNGRFFHLAGSVIRTSDLLLLTQRIFSPSLFQSTLWVHAGGSPVYPAQERQWPDELPEQGPVLPHHPKRARGPHGPTPPQWSIPSMSFSIVSLLFLFVLLFLSLLPPSLCVFLSLLSHLFLFYKFLVSRFGECFGNDLLMEYFRVWWCWCLERKSSQMTSSNTGDTGTADSTQPSSAALILVRGYTHAFIHTLQSYAHTTACMHTHTLTHTRAAQLIEFTSKSQYWHVQYSYRKKSISHAIFWNASQPCAMSVFIICYVFFLLWPLSAHIKPHPLSLKQRSPSSSLLNSLYVCMLLC